MNPEEDQKEQKANEGWICDGEEAIPESPLQVCAVPMLVAIVPSGRTVTTGA
ncbi:hypothetical protein RND71_023146 [Anisodus tanguticus]|uniref:Uncharacterized protein n=1 Tax=Anisodus tanguticus TaxID=243964 RepID=A0AAE1VBB6_9SOLA|nr:hypothetical protein RND71_023146 [Anisodus tanguticus]